MENIKEYIESGILEQYVLGDLSLDERMQVEEKALLYPEIREEIQAIELAMEQYAMQNAIAPPTAVERRLFEASGLSHSIDLQNTDHKNTETQIRKLNSDGNITKIRILRYALVACIALLLVSGIALMITYNKLNEAHDQIANLSLDKQKFAGLVSKLEYNNKGLEQTIAMSNSSDWTTVKLQGQSFSPDSKMLVYWNKQNKSVLINYVAMNLPKTDDSHDYQLWALVNSKPVSLGVFSSEDVNKSTFLEMHTVQGAQAFAVTLEKRGGSINPTMEKMIVMGRV